MKILLISLGWTLVFLSFVFLSAFDSQQIVAPCVDGDGDINLEGIMCDKTVYTFLGYKQSSSESSILFMIFLMSILFGILIIILGVLKE